MKNFFRTLEQQRWDDHRYYHHSRINQSLHLLSAVSFLVSYVYLFIDPVVAGLLAWLVSMVSRQVGHFFFEPTGYDNVNEATHAHKEEIKVGYNLFRKVVLMSVWALIPVFAYFLPQYLTWLVPEVYEDTPIRMTAIAWLFLGVFGLLFRVGQIWQQDCLLAGLAWAFKILTDPFHDIKLYFKSPIYLLKGQLIDPMEHVVASKSS
jgi:F0F1-type ATP synthase assembly protein I